jgi:hypothetical protein
MKNDKYNNYGKWIQDSTIVVPKLRGGELYKYQERKGDTKNMKVVKHYEFAIEDQDEMLEKWGKYLEKSAKTPEKYPKYIVGPYALAQTGDSMKGISIMEIDNDEQLINYILELSPPLKADFKLLFDTAVYVPAYMATKK